MILPVLDYAGFLLISCNLGERRELQLLQNDALRSCCMYNRDDHVRLDELHRNVKLLGLEQRRILQLLRLMYLHSKDLHVLRVPERNTRNSTKVIFKVPARCKTIYLNSPFYKGKLLWDKLQENVQKCGTVEEFVLKLKTMYNGYEAIYV